MSDQPDMKSRNHLEPLTDPRVFHLRKRFTLKYLFAVPLLLFLTAGCATHAVNPSPAPLVAPASFSAEQPPAAAGRHRWWTEFADPRLEALIDQSLAGSFTLAQSYARLAQARAADQRAASLLYPALTGSGSGRSSRRADGSIGQNLAASLELAWEVDLWQRLASARKAAVFQTLAAAEELQAAALLLSAQVAETYFQLIEQQQQLALLDRQLELSRTFLELITLRFAYGEASVVDIYQQRQQVAAIEAQQPLVRGRLDLLRQRLQVLLGQPPSIAGPELAGELPAAPPLPVLGVPADLLVNRPDLRQRQRGLVAADHRIAEAIADRLPRIRLLGASGFQGERLTGAGLFASMLAEVAGPIVDWGNRRSEVERREAVMAEELARYTQAYLVAIEEVENALSRERWTTEQLAALARQLAIAEANLAETRNRYMQGLTDYLPVLTALQSLQNLEREILTRRQELLAARILLYRALGGAELLAVGGQD
jgi:NodT family efflux transporter outer membrane factor (OMF) lipoprotein